MSSKLAIATLHYRYAAFACEKGVFVWHCTYRVLKVQLNTKIIIFPFRRSLASELSRVSWLDKLTSYLSRLIIIYRTRAS